MKHVKSPIEGASTSTDKPPGRRALAKQKTRAKVLKAARRLFSEQGYEGATIRDIAEAAGMSTGAVFASFADKSDLFHEIMVGDIAAVTADMRQAAAHGRSVEDALLRIFTAGYAFYKGQLHLARAAFTVSWLLGDERPILSVETLYEIIADQLDQAILKGELFQASDVRLRTEMLFDSYLANYRHAIHGGWSLDQLQARSRDQIRVILAGARQS